MANTDIFPELWANLNTPIPMPTLPQAKSHPFDGMHFDSEDDPRDEDVRDDLYDDEDAEDEQDADYIDDDFLPHAPAIPPPIPTHSRPMRAPAPKPHTAIPVANAQHRGTVNSRAIILPAHNPQQKNRPRPARKMNVPTPPLVASSRPSNVRRAGAPSHRATLSIGSAPGAATATGVVEAADPSIPDPNEEGIIMISGAEAMTMTFLEFQPNMYLIRQELTDQLYPSFLEPPSKLTPLRCLCCKKIYNGPNARSMWRRHITQKHNFTLGGKKGNGKGKKEHLDDENKFPSDGIEDPSLRRREHTLQAKREWARNRRLEGKFTTPRQPSAEFNTNNVFSFLPDHTNSGNTTFDGPSFESAPAPMFWPVEGNGGHLQPNPAQALNALGLGDEEDDDDDEEEVPLSVQLSNGLAPSPSLPSPNSQPFGALPISENQIHHPEPELVENDEDDEAVDAQLGFKAPHCLNSDFDFDFSLGNISAADALATSPVVPANRPMPTFSQTQEHHPGPMFRLADLLTQPLGRMAPDTPGRGLAMSDAERRRMILSMESPTSYPAFARSKTSNGLPRMQPSVAPSTLQTTGPVVTPNRSGLGMARSVTMPVLLSSAAATASENLQSLLNATPARPVSMDFFPTPVRTMGWLFESPVLKRKRSSTEEGILSAIAANANSGEGDGDVFEKYFDLPGSPLKGFWNAGGAENAFGGEDDGRVIKKGRVSM